MKCSKCNSSEHMVQLFTSWACDYCDGKTAPTLGPIGQSGWLGDTTPRPWRLSERLWNYSKVDESLAKWPSHKYLPGSYKPQKV